VPGTINAGLNTSGSAQNPSVQSAQSPAPNAVLPKYYTVGAWPPDCFWVIAELVYGDPFRWTILYEANRSKLEDPDNPDLLEAGAVLEIPSINGERREGYYTR
jgi:nucleoid-associated protein YgaU